RSEISSIVQRAKSCGLDPSLLYECVIELTSEGLLTATCINAAVGILLTDLGLPAYFFRGLSKDSLKIILQTIASNIRIENGQYVLRSEVSEVPLKVEGGVQVRIATDENRDRMEKILNPVMSGNRIEYYFGKKHRYYTYIIRPEKCKELSELKKGESPFAFNNIVSGTPIPETTKKRYEEFLEKTRKSFIPIISISEAKETGETRIMFKEDFSKSILPVIRKMFEELNITLTRAYWETYRGKTGRIESICSVYLEGKVPEEKLKVAIERLHFLLSIQPIDLDELYTQGYLSFFEYIFANVAAVFVHTFIYKDEVIDNHIMANLDEKQLRDGFAKRIFESNRAEYTRNIIMSTIKQNPHFIKQIFSIFDAKFNPLKEKKETEKILSELNAYERNVRISLVDDTTGADIFLFMSKLVTELVKTNFYQVKKRSFAFKFTNNILDHVVFQKKVESVFFVVGFYSISTYMRAEEISRGGIRLIRVTKNNYETELDNMPLLNYALGPVAQRLKHKDIAESGAKGVIVPYPDYAFDALEATIDFANGILDLILPSDEILDYHGKTDIVFFGPDEGTGDLMDTIANLAKKRNYRYWRTITTGKSTGIPHDTYGLTLDKKVFGLFGEPDCTRLVIEGKEVLKTDNTDEIYNVIGENIYTSGMTTTSVMACLRTLLKYTGLKEEQVNLMMTGGPDGDLGANQIQSFKGKIKLIIDSGSVLFDPDGLDKKELMKIAFARHTKPRLNSLAYPENKIGQDGFRIPRVKRHFKLPDGSIVEDGTFFHRNFLSDLSMRRFIEKAEINVFVPCGGFKDTINAGNVSSFLELFRELKIIVEGANVFFDDTARDVIAGRGILQIRDSSANKGGVTSSSIAEVLPSFLLGDEYEKILVEDQRTKVALIKSVFSIIEKNSVLETQMLLALWEKTGKPLHQLSIETSEMLIELQTFLYNKLPAILKRASLVEKIIESYVPDALVKILGIATILETLNKEYLKSYRDAIITKKIAQIALYRCALDWDGLKEKIQSDIIKTVEELFESSD
ncbi:MAG: NAD-glutamate dehydrogenase, partial [Candidatus Omnitrophica bacterium]|nr:NAD-glutamate dehydrogenase [Candidatus Omnitrophota bacterium]